MWRGLLGVLVLGLLAEAETARETARETTSEDPEFGALKLCPPGGRAFMLAWNLACEMKRKRRKRGTGGGARFLQALLHTHHAAKRSSAKESRPATLEEIMKICCVIGCEIRDLLPYCDPFGSWNS